MMVRALIIIFYLSCINLVFAQTVKEINDKIESSREMILNGKKEEYLRAMEEIIRASSKLEYPFGIASGYYGKSYVAFNERNFSNSIQFAKLAEKEELGNDHWILKTRTYHILGLNYSNIGLNDLALRYYKKMVVDAKKIPDEKQSVFHENVAYNDLASLYKVQKNNVDSASYYMVKIYKNLSSYPKRDMNMDVLLAKATLSLGEASKIKGKKDSMDFYMKKSLTQIPSKVPQNNDNLNIYSQLTTIYTAQGKYADANKTNVILMKRSQKIKSLDLINHAYKYKYIIAEKTANSKNTTEYLKNYVTINDSLNAVNEVNVKNAYNNIIKEKDIEIVDKSQRSKYLIWSIVIIILVVILVLYFIKKRYNEKRQSLNRTQSEISELEQKINTAFEEVVLLAKSNDPTFLTRFREVYPEFCQKMIDIYPGIQNSELEFCAYIRLNFSTKDIASFIFVTPKTIQMRKYRLRKKLNIPTENDIYIWINNL